MSLYEQHSAVSSMCESLLLLVTWKTKSTVNSWKSGKTETEKGLKIGSIWPDQSALWEQGIVGILCGERAAAAICDKPSSTVHERLRGKMFKQLNRVQLFPPPHSPQPGFKPSVIIHRLCGLGIETEWKGNKRRPLMLCLFLFPCQTFQGNFN